jgi:hypothetical protein
MPTSSGTSQVATPWQATSSDAMRSWAWFGLLRPKGFRLSEHDVLGNDEHVCALSVMGARRDGVDVQTRVVSVSRCRDGQQLERWFYPEDPMAWDAIFTD